MRRKKLKVLLVNLPWQKEGLQGVRAGSRWPHLKDPSEGDYMPFPFFLAYATSLLRKHDIKANMIDAIAKQIPEDKFIEDLHKMNFDILVAETSVPSFYHDMELLRRISAMDVPVVLCGPHPKIYKPEFLKGNNFIDFVLFGEYEFTLLELIKAISANKKNFSSIKGLIWKNSDENIIKNLRSEPFDINLLPWPHRDTLPMEKYWDLPGDIPQPSIQMVASRGCPFRCSFCLWPQLLFGGNIYRMRSVKNCIAEMEFWIKKNGFKSVYFDDDTFNIGKNRMLEFSNEIIKRGLNKIPWAIMAKPDLMDKEILDNMRGAGLHAIKYGIESSSQELLNNCNKSLDLKKTERIIKYTKSLDVKVHLTFCLGLPGETKYTIKKTVDYALGLDPATIQFSILTPFPGTALFADLEGRGRIITKDWSFYDGHHSCVFKPENLSPEDLEQAKHYAYRRWADCRRKKRGFWGHVKIFFNYWQKDGLVKAIGKSVSYLNYLYHNRKGLD